jgi:hypothetical protein
LQDHPKFTEKCYFWFEKMASGNPALGHPIIRMQQFYFLARKQSAIFKLLNEVLA